MNDTWRFIVVILLIVALGTLLPFVADAAPATVRVQDLRAHAP